MPFAEPSVVSLVDPQFAAAMMSVESSLPLDVQAAAAAGMLAEGMDVQSMWDATFAGQWGAGMDLSRFSAGVGGAAASGVDSEFGRARPPMRATAAEWTPQKSRR